MERLKVYRMNLERAIERRPDFYPCELHGKRLSLGEAVQQLLNSQDRHGERAKASRKKQACKDRGKDATIVPATQGEEG